MIAGVDTDIVMDISACGLHDNPTIVHLQLQLVVEMRGWVKDGWTG